MEMRQTVQRRSPRQFNGSHNDLETGEETMFKENMNSLIKLSALPLLAVTLIGCSSVARQASNSYTEEVKIREVVVETQQPGTVEMVWEEPMVQIVDVPPGLDPEGYYYRPAHREVVEIRQGRYRVLGGKSNK